MGSIAYGLTWSIACVLVLVCPCSSVLSPGGSRLVLDVVFFVDTMLSLVCCTVLCGHCCCTVNGMVFTVRGWFMYVMLYLLPLRYFVVSALFCVVFSVIHVCCYTACARCLCCASHFLTVYCWPCSTKSTNKPMWHRCVLLHTNSKSFVNTWHIFKKNIRSNLHCNCKNTSAGLPLLFSASALSSNCNNYILSSFEVTFMANIIVSMCEIQHSQKALCSQTVFNFMHLQILW